MYFTFAFFCVLIDKMNKHRIQYEESFGKKKTKEDKHNAKRFGKQEQESTNKVAKRRSMKTKR